MNNAITEIKSTLEGTNSRITEAENRISEVEDRMVEINEAEVLRTHLPDSSVMLFNAGHCFYCPLHDCRTKLPGKLRTEFPGVQKK